MIDVPLGLPGRYAPDEEFAQIRGPVLSDRGSSRLVYEIQGNGGYVLKECRLNPTANGANWEEVVFFAAFRKKVIEDGLYPLAAVPTWSLTGRFLVMERLRPLSDQDQFLREHFPPWVTDRQRKNLGKTEDGIFKVTDYAMTTDPSEDDPYKSPYR